MDSSSAAVPTLTEWLCQGYNRLAIGPVGAAVADGLEEQPLAIRVAVGFLDQAFEDLWIQLAHLSVCLV
jgi:hypothetical protein